MVKLIINMSVISDKLKRSSSYHQQICEESKLLSDDYHFLFLCKRLQVLRLQYNSHYFWKRQYTNTFVELLTSDQ